MEKDNIKEFDGCKNKYRETYKEKAFATKELKRVFEKGGKKNGKKR